MDPNDQKINVKTSLLTQIIRSSSISSRPEPVSAVFGDIQPEEAYLDEENKEDKNKKETEMPRFYSAKLKTATLDDYKIISKEIPVDSSQI